MKLRTAIVALFLAVGTQAVAAPLEEDAVLTNGWTREHAQTLANEASAIIRAHGFRCDTVSNIQRWVFSSGFDISCNGFRYEYELEDRGGRWTPSLK